MSVVRDGHEDCRLNTFWRWNRIMLEHERQYLSKIMATSTAFISQEDRESLVHDVADIDWCLRFHPQRVRTPNAS